MAKKFPKIDEIEDIALRCDEYPGCCRGLVLFDFPNCMEKMSAESWLHSLCENDIFISDGRAVLFSHSSKESKGAASPSALAKFLRRRKEKVSSVKVAHMTFYTWVPSKKFQSEMDKFKAEYGKRKKEVSDSYRY